MNRTPTTVARAALVLAVAAVTFATACSTPDSSRESSGSSTLDAQYVEHRDAADAAWNRGDPREALRRIARALERAPSAREPYERASTYWSALGEDEEAARFFDITTRLSPDSPWPWYYRGFHLFRSGAWNDALSDFGRASGIDPSLADARFRQGLVLQAMGDFDAALGHLRAAHDAAPDDPVFAERLARLLRITGDYPAARAVVDDALLRSPGSADLHAALGELRMRDGDRAGAETALRRALEIDPGQADAHVRLSRILAADGRAAEAERHADAAARVAEYRDAARAWTARADADDAGPEPSLAMAELEATSGDPRAALRWIRRAEAAGAPTDRSAIARAEAHYALGDVDSGDRALLELVDAEGARFELARARGFLARGDAERARAAFERAERTAPGEREFLRRLSDLAFALGDVERSDAIRRSATAAPRILPVEPSGGMGIDATP